jgi:DNA-binding CsgD family transcriptional regulator
MIRPMAPLTFLLFLFALATGFVSLAWVSRRSHAHYSPVTESLIPPLMFYNLWFLIWLILQYTEANLLGGLSPTLGRFIVGSLIWASMVAAILWGASYLAFTLRATHPTHPEDLLRRTRRGALLLMGGTALASLAFFLLHRDPFIRTLSRTLSTLIFPLVAILSLRLFLRARSRGEEASWRKLRILGAIYSILFLTLTTLVWWRRLAPAFHRPTYLTLNVGLEMVYNLVTVLWVHVFDRTLPAPGAASPDPEPGHPIGPTFAGDFGISKRELEVIQLICGGLTNQEIADRLFISLKTVKDHNYRIFQKTGVRNRVELVQLAREMDHPTPAA